MSYFLLFLWRNKYFVSVTLKENLLARNRWMVLLFTAGNSTGMSQFEKKRLVSSENIIR